MGDDLVLRFSQGLLDFHTHSTHSDGKETPSELVNNAKKHGISVLALTDHNVISGLEEFNIACKREGIFAIPFGTEIYAELPNEIVSYGENEAPDLVMLGKNVRTDVFGKYLKQRKEDFSQRFIPETLNKLESIGFNIPCFKMEQQAEMGVPTIFYDFMKKEGNSEVLVNYVGGIDKGAKREDIEKNPEKFLKRYIYCLGGPAYVKRCEGFSVEDAVKLADEMNTLLFIAHPGGGFDITSDKVLNYYIKKRIQGIEVRNYFHTPEQNTKFDEIARKNALIRSGGSDYHGSEGMQKIGMWDRAKNQLPKDILEELWYNLPA